MTISPSRTLFDSQNSFLNRSNALYFNLSIENLIYNMIIHYSTEKKTLNLKFLNPRGEEQKSKNAKNDNDASFGGKKIVHIILHGML